MYSAVLIYSDVCGSAVVRTGCYNCPGLMVWFCTSMLILYIKDLFYKVLFYYMLLVTLCEVLFFLFSFFNPNNLILRHLRVGIRILWTYLVSIFEGRKVGSLQMVSELRLSEYLGSVGLDSLEIGLVIP